MHAVPFVKFRLFFWRLRRQVDVHPRGVAFHLGDALDIERTAQQFGHRPYGRKRQARVAFLVGHRCREGAPRPSPASTSGADSPLLTIYEGEKGKQHGKGVSGR
jgi:hypothetical protein